MTTLSPTFSPVSAIVAGLSVSVREYRAKPYQPVTEGVRQMYGIAVDMGDRAARIACSVAGRAVRLGAIRYTNRKGYVGVLVNEGKYSARTTRTSPKHVRESFRQFPEFDDMFGTCYLAIEESIAKDPTLTDAQLGGFAKFRLVNVITANGRDTERAANRARNTTEQTANAATPDTGWLTDHWDALTNDERDIVIGLRQGRTNVELAEQMGVVEGTIRNRLKGLSRFLEPLPKAELVQV